MYSKIFVFLLVYGYRSGKLSWCIAVCIQITNLVLMRILQVHTTSQSSPMQAYNQAINDLDKELDHLKNAFEVCDLILFLHFSFN